MKVEAVLFDLDGTLLDRDKSLLMFIRDQYHRLSALHIIEEDVFVQRFIELDHHGYVWKDRVYKQIIDEFLVPSIDWAVLLDDYITNFQNHCVGFPNLLNTLNMIKKKGIKLALVSNGYGQFQYDNFKALKIEHLFDEVLISEWEGLRKPDKAIFNRALSKLGINAENALFVGDHPVNDIQASRNVGMKAVWKRNSQYESATEADAEIDDLSELIDIISKFNNS